MKWISAKRGKAIHTQYTQRNTMSNTIETQPTGKEQGLIKHLSIRNYQLREQEKETSKAMLLAVKMIAECGGDPFDYVEKMEVEAMIEEYSTIGDYTNKKGVVSKAHFNSNKTYVGSVKKKGDKPILTRYKGIISRKTHTFNGEWFKQKPLKKSTKKKLRIVESFE